MKYAIVTMEKFWHFRQGADITISNKFKLLNGEKILIFVGRLDKNEKTSFEKKYNCKVFVIYPFLYNIVRAVRMVLRKAHLNKFYFLKKPFRFSIFTRHKMNKIIKNEECNAVICEYIWLSGLFKSNEKYVKIIETHDIQYLLCEQCKKMSKELSIGVKQKHEIAIYKKFDVVCCVSHPDMDYFKQYLNNLCYLPPIYETQTKDAACKKDKLNIGFIGGLAQFNVDAIMWFLDNVLPRLEDVTVNVYGKVCDMLAVKPTDNLLLHGPVDDLADVYINNHIMINPTFIAGGIKTKNVEALSYGKIVLTTTQGARGLNEFVDKGHILVCDDPESYIKHINDFKTKIEEIEKNRDERISFFREMNSEEFIRNAEEIFESKYSEKTKAVVQR